MLNLLLAGMALPVAYRASAAEQILALRKWASSDRLRIVFDLSGPVSFKTFSLEAPQRLVLDIAGARLARPAQELVSPGGVIKDVRSGAHGSGTRIVLELTQKAEANVFTLAPSGDKGHRLVLDLLDENAAPAVADTAATAAVPVARVAASNRDLIVVVDAGHGGKDPGAVGQGGEKEKVVALAIAQALAKQINAQKGYKAKLVRNDDFFVPLRKRVEIARRYKADMFVSVHADAAPRRSASGASVFALSEKGASSTMARWMAKQENSADRFGAGQVLSLKDTDPMVAGVILDMSMTATIGTSLDLTWGTAC